MPGSQAGPATPETSNKLTCNAETTDCTRMHGIRMLLVLLLALTAFQTAQAAPLTGLALQYFPSADRVGEFEGDPLAAAVYQGDQVVGYVLRLSLIHI